MQTKSLVKVAMLGLLFGALVLGGTVPGSARDKYETIDATAYGPARSLAPISVSRSSSTSSRPLRTGRF